jgi:hypothetical protein
LADPTRPSPTPVPRRARFVLALALAVVAALAACSTISSFADLIEELQEEGFTDVSANIDQRNASALVVSADAPAGTTVTDAQDQAAEVVWTRFPRRFEGLRVTIDGEREEWTYDQLEDELGPRPAGLEDGDLGDDINQVALIAVIGTLVAGVVGIAVVGLIVFLVVRANRRNRPPRPTWPHPQPWMPPPPGMPTSGGPVPPPGGWAPAGAPPGPTPAPPSPPSLAKAPVPPFPPAPAGRRRRDPDARRLGRRPRGATPDKAHTPPGWG